MEVNSKNILEEKLKEAEQKILSLTVENQTLQLSLKESEILHKSVVENSLDGTIIFDEDFDVEYSNIVVEEITGYTLDELQKFNFLDIISKDDREKFRRSAQRLFNREIESDKFELSLLNKDGSERYNLASLSFTDDFQSTNSIILQILDITDIKAAEKRQIEINKELEQKVDERTKELQEAKEEVVKALVKEKELNSLKTRFISMISHEYRTPLTVILTSTYLIEQFYEGSRQQEFEKFLKKIRSSVNDMTQLLEDVLTIGRNESGKSKLFPQNIDILKYLQEIIEEVKVVDKNRHKIQINYSIMEENIISDEKALKHIFQNLLGNACKYSPNSDKITISIDDDEDNNENVKIKVRDYGIGVPQEDLPKLFETFHRAINVGSIQGTGLGLAIVKRSVESIHGKIDVWSKEDEGTEFSVTIPKNIGGFVNKG